jgi:hypothetical protein
MMAGGMLATKGLSPIHDGAGKPRGGVQALDDEHIASARREISKDGEDERKGSRFKLMVAIEQWICLALGVVCVASGIWGAFLKVSESASHAYLAWLGAAYVPTLRGTAVACLVMGLLLVHRAVTPP